MVAFPVQAPNGSGGCPSGYGFGANGVLGQSNVFTATYIPASTETVPIVMTFTMDGNSQAIGNNDDYHASIAFGAACSC